MPREPKTRGEWQDAVDAAYVYSLIDSARKYGLVTGGPGVNVDRCEEILRRGKKRGVTPSRDWDYVERVLSEWTNVAPGRLGDQ